MVVTIVSGILVALTLLGFSVVRRRRERQLSKYGVRLNAIGRNILCALTDVGDPSYEYYRRIYRDLFKSLWDQCQGAFMEPVQPHMNRLFPQQNLYRLDLEPKTGGLHGFFCKAYPIANAVAHFKRSLKGRIKSDVLLPDASITLAHLRSVLERFLLHATSVHERLESMNRRLAGLNALAILDPDRAIAIRDGSIIPDLEALIKEIESASFEADQDPERARLLQEAEEEMEAHLRSARAATYAPNQIDVRATDGANQERAPAPASHAPPQAASS